MINATGLRIACEDCFSLTFELVLVDMHTIDEPKPHLFARCANCKGQKDFGPIDFPAGEIRMEPRIPS